MKEIKLTNGRIAIVSDEDYTKVAPYKWRAHRESCGIWYVIGEVNNKTIRMHRFILNITDPKILIDHKNGDGLNNSRENIRLCTHQQNCQNRRVKETSQSIYKGVGYRNGRNKIEAYISHNGKREHIGFYCTEIEAAKAYNEKAKEYFGEFARLNAV